MSEFGARMREEMAAVRLAIVWMGVRKALDADQKKLAAEPFSAEAETLSIGKKLINTRNPKFRAVSKVRHKAVEYWKFVSVPYPEDGVRLIRRDQVDDFSGQMVTLQSELGVAVSSLETSWSELKNEARTRLGDLYNESDYPVRLGGLFSISYDFPSTDPPDYLAQLSPRLYEAEQARVRAKFDEAVRLTEQAFTSELKKLVDHLAERMDGKNDDGTPKEFRGTTVTHLTDFFSRFNNLNIRSNPELEALVRQAQDVIKGIKPEALREDQNLRARLAANMAGVKTAIDGLMVDRPTRRVSRPQDRIEPEV